MAQRDGISIADSGIVVQLCSADGRAFCKWLFRSYSACQ